MNAPRRPHYIAEVSFDVEGDSARRAALVELRDAVEARAGEGAAIDDTLAAEADGAALLVDLTGTDADLRPHRLLHLVDQLTAQILRRPNFPDTIPIRWSRS